MKKKLVVSVLLALLTSNVSAGILLKSGDVNVFSENVNVQVVFDYSKAKIMAKDMTLEDFIEQKGYKYEQNWEMAQNMSHKDFIKRFNKKNGSFKIGADSTASTKYKMIIQVRTIDMGNTAKSLLPVGRNTDGGVILQGRIYIKDTKGNEVCQLRFTDIKGLGSTSIQSRMLQAYMAFNSSLSKFIKKNVAQVSKVDADEDDDENEDEESEDDEDEED